MCVNDRGVMGAYASCEGAWRTLVGAEPWQSTTIAYLYLTAVVTYKRLSLRPLIPANNFKAVLKFLGRCCYM